MGKVLPFPAPPSAEDTAQAWIVRIDRGPLDPDERAALHAWLAADPRHGGLLDMYAKLWHAAGRTGAASAHASTAAPRKHAPAARRGIALGAGAAIAAAAVACVIWLGGANPAPEAPLLLWTGAGQHQPYAMSDGSRIELNTRSQARVTYRPEQRRIALLAGEGLFDVAKDRKRPFIVSAGATEVRAVGTRFTVRRRADGQVEVVVHEGVVSVTQSDGAAAGANEVPRSATLAAGQVLDTRKGGFAVARVDAARLPQLLAWQQGRVAFDDAPLPAVLDEMNRYSAMPIRIGDARLASLRLSGSFSTQNIDAFVRTLEQALGVKVQRRPAAYIVLPARAA